MPPPSPKPSHGLKRSPRAIQALATCRSTATRKAYNVQASPAARRQCGARATRDRRERQVRRWQDQQSAFEGEEQPRSEEHTSELQSLMRISYAVFCLKKKKT